MTARETITVRIRDINGEPMLDATGMGLMFGVKPEEIPTGPFPAELIQQGRRRAGEAKAHTGRSDFESVVRYWARADHGADLEIVYEGGTQ